MLWGRAYHGNLISSEAQGHHLELNHDPLPFLLENVLANVTYQSAVFLSKTSVDNGAAWSVDSSVTWLTDTPCHH